MTTHDNMMPDDMMREEILENIFGFLDIGSKKNFSLVCKRFNHIFGLPRHLDQIKFCVTKERGQMCEITRNYRHIVEPGNLIPAASLPKFTHLTSYTKGEDMEDPFSEIKANYLVGLLPHFRYLSCLDLRVETDGEQLAQIFEDRLGFDAIEMKHLRTLKIELQLFLFLNDRFVKFSSDMLEILKIVVFLCFDQNFDFSPVKSLITKQKHLKVLSLQAWNHRVSEMFDTPFIVSSQLKAFKLVSDHGFESEDDLVFGYNSTQQDHLADFLMAQNALEKLEINIGVGTTPATSKMQYLMNSRLRMPLVKRKIRVWNDMRADSIDINIFSLNELSQSQSLNPATKHVKLNLDLTTPEAYRAVVEFVSLNYSSLMSLEILGYQNPFYGIDALNRLNHLESLTLSLYEFRTPSAIHIQTLKKLQFLQYDERDTGGWNCAYKGNLKLFFNNHKLIEEISMKLGGSAARNAYDQMDYEVNAIVENALMELPRLRKLTISVDWYLINDPTQYSSERKTLLDSWLNCSKLLTESMKRHANSGFVLQCGPSEYSRESKKLMKTFDGAVVETE